MDELACHVVNDWPVIRLVYTTSRKYEVQENQATGYDHFDWVTLKDSFDMQVALHMYTEKLVCTTYTHYNLKAPAVTFLHHNLYG